MARLLKYNFGVGFAILLSTIVLVNSLPTSVLVDTKQQQNEQTAALNKGKICMCQLNKYTFSMLLSITSGWLNHEQIM